MTEQTPAELAVELESELDRFKRLDTVHKALAEQHRTRAEKAEADRDTWKAQCHALAAENERLWAALAGKEKTND